MLWWKVQVCINRQLVWIPKKSYLESLYLVPTSCSGNSWLANSFVCFQVEKLEPKLNYTWDNIRNEGKDSNHSGFVKNLWRHASCAFCFCLLYCGFAFWLIMLFCKEDEMNPSFNVLFILFIKGKKHIHGIIVKYSAIQPLIFYIIPLVTFIHSHSCLRKRLSWFVTHLLMNE